MLGAGLLALGPACAAAQDCTPRLTVTEASGGVAAVYTDPCAPYAAVTVTHGPLVFGEETGRTGTLRLDLPALPGGGILAVTRDGTVTRAALPAPAGPVPPLAAISWPDAPPPDLPGARLAESGHGTAPRSLGFPGAGPRIDLFPGTPDHIDLPLTAATCGRAVAGVVITTGSVRDLRVTLPGCDAPPGALRIPLAL